MARKVHLLKFVDDPHTVCGESALGLLALDMGVLGHQKQVTCMRCRRAISFDLVERLARLTPFHEEDQEVLDAAGAQIERLQKASDDRSDARVDEEITSLRAAIERIESLADEWAKGDATVAACANQLRHALTGTSK